MPDPSGKPSGFSSKYLALCRSTTNGPGRAVREYTKMNLLGKFPFVCKQIRANHRMAPNQRMANDLKKSMQAVPLQSLVI
jgi:hypothetical protein